MTHSQDRPLKPDWMLKPGPLKTLHEKGIDAYRKELKERAIRATEKAEEKRRERLNYLFKIDFEQGNDRIMWPYDLAKMMGSCKETLQFCRETDHLYDYIRENPKHEYDPDNYKVKYYPDYNSFMDFENDNGSDYDDFYDDF